MTSHPSKQNIKVAVDAIIFTIKDGALQVLLIQMKKSPFTDQWAVPGGLIYETETTQEAATRMLTLQTGVTDVYLEQLMTFDSVKRDPAGRVISVAYFALLPNAHVKLKTTEKYQNVRWWPIAQLPHLAYDHKQMIAVAVERLTSKIQYTNIVWSLLPREFTLTQLQHVYEVILNTTFDKRNFRKRMLAFNLINLTGKKQTGTAYRPANLYRFRQRTLEFVGL